MLGIIQQEVIDTMNEITIGFEIGTGKKVSMEPNHLVISGKTRAGKSKLMEALIDRSDLRFLILDAKWPRDYDRFGSDIPLYIEEMMDPVKLKSLVSGERVSLADLDRLVEDSESWDDIVRLAQEREASKKTHPVVKDRLRVISILFGKLIDEMEQFEFSEGIELPNKVNVMDMSRLSLELQQIVVSSTIRYIQRNLSNVVVVIDEAHRFIPQRSSSACSSDVVDFVREGAALSNLLWLSDQTITGVSKEALKQVETWILGRQREINEAKKTIDQIPQRKSLGLRPEDIQTLRTGEFLVVSENWAKKTYAWPIWIDDEKARKVALGEIKIKDIKKLEPVDDDEDMWKERYNTLKQEYNRLKKQSEELKSSDIDLDEQIAKERKEISDVIEEYKTSLKKCNEQVESLEKTIETQNSTIESQKKHEKEILKQLKAFNDLKESLDLLVSGNNINEDAIVEKVVKRIGPSGRTYTVEPLKALKLDWQKRAVNTAKKKIDELDPEQREVLKFLVSSLNYQNKADIMRGIYGIDYKQDKAKYERLAKNIDELAETGLLYLSGGRFKADIQGFLRNLVGSEVAADSNLIKHVIEYLRKKT